MEPAAALRPLNEAADSIRRLDDYQTREELADAVSASVAALERALRLRLRVDPSAPEAHRVSALSPEALPFDDVVKSLRTRDLISLRAAGTVHEARAAAARAEAEVPGATDADLVRQAIALVREELASAEPGAVGPAEPGSEPAPAEDSPAVDRVEDTSPHTGRWMAWVAAAVAALVVLGTAWVALRGAGADSDDAVRAFRAGRYDSAAVAFERLLEDRPEDVTLMLYLGRTYRRLGQYPASAEVLRRAVDTDLRDPTARRELGHLFMELDRPGSAVTQYEQAVEYGPDEPLNWAALIRGLQAADDPRWQSMAEQAPPEVRALLDWP